MAFDSCSKSALTGQLGERIVDAFLRQQGWIPYRPEADRPHPFDRLVASGDKRRLCVHEVKTKFCREAYEDTGIDERHFNDYQQITMRYTIPLFLSFVDGKKGTMYGNWWHELLKTREHGGRIYPWHQGGIVYFPLSAMRTLHVLSEPELIELRQLRVSSWK